MTEQLLEIDRKFLKGYLPGRLVVGRFHIFSAICHYGPCQSCQARGIPYPAGKARREKIQDLLLGFIVGVSKGC